MGNRHAVTDACRSLSLSVKYGFLIAPGIPEMVSFFHQQDHRIDHRLLSGSLSIQPNTVFTQQRSNFHDSSSCPPKVLYSTASIADRVVRPSEKALALPAASPIRNALS